jgi:hypothetical protein
MEHLLPAFPLFVDPVREGVFVKSPKACGVCARARGWVHVGPVYGASTALEELVICPWCNAEGAAVKLGAFFNPALTDPSTGSSRLSAEDAHVVRCFTPGYNTWDGNHWGVCCGRACRSVGAADAEDLRERWRGAVASMLKGSKRSETQIEDVVGRVTADGETRVYVFQFRACEGLRGHLDRN